MAFMPSGRCLPLILWALATSAYSRQFRLHQSSNAGPLDGFYPDEVLCTLGKDANGNTQFFKWCIDWIKCIDSKAQPSGTPEAVLKAWGPASCHEMCGLWPPPPPTTTTQKPTTTTEKQTVKAKKPKRKRPFCPPWVAPAECERIAKMAMEFAKMNKTTSGEKNTIGTALLDVRQREKNECLASCENFKKTFTTCVSTIIFEPGKLGNMGGLQQKGGGLRKKTPEVCTKKDTHCMPDLAVRRQRCIHHRTHSILNPHYEAPDEDTFEICHHIESDYDDCKDCPQLNNDYQTQYAAFTGGCLEQMHAYYKATAPVDASGTEPFDTVGIPRETGQCRMQ